MKSLTYCEVDAPTFAPGMRFAATRARWLTSSAASPTAIMSRSGHRAWADISQLYIYVQNARLSPVNINNDFQGEVGLGASATVTASIEYPAGTFTQVKFGGSASTSVTNKQIKKSDLITLSVTIPAGEIFWVRIFYSNASGVIYNAWQDSATYGDAVHKTSATDQTMSGTVVDDSGWSHPPAAIIASTTLASVGIIGDSIGYGNAGPAGGEAAPYIGDTGVVAKSIAATIPFQNLSACGACAAAGSTSDRYWISSGQPRRELVQYCTQIVSELGINDLWGVGGIGAQTAVQLVSHLVALWGVLRGTYGFTGDFIVQCTLGPHTSSTDNWLSTTGQTPSAETAERIAFNDLARALLTGTIATYDIAALLESDINSGLWRVPGGANLLPGTLDFSGWFVNAATLTGGFADAFGGSNAFKLVENSGAGPHYTSMASVGSPAGTYCFTVYAKQSGRRLELRLAAAGGTDFAYVVFDLVGGQVGTSGVGGSGYSVSTSSIAAVSGGYYRCRAVIVAGSAVAAGFLVLDNGTGTGALSQNYTGNGTSGVFVQGAQLEHGSTATTYNAATPTALTDDGLHPNNAGYQYVADSGVIESISPYIRFAIDTDYLPRDIDCIPSIKAVTIQPAIIGLGSDLGQRASVTITFKDHKHIFGSESFDSGTFWGKWRARYGLKLRGHGLRLIRGLVGQVLADMETRRYIIDASDGPNATGEYKIIAKDVLKFADGDRAQAPVLSNGFLASDITNSATSATLSPSGIGNAEYPASGIAAIGGSEIVTFTRSGDTLTITRAQFNTEAKAHTGGDRVQLCLQYNGLDVATILNDLFVNYAAVPDDYIPLSDWIAEVNAYLGVNFSALIAEPTSVNTLASELVEQAGLAIWWDDIGQQIRLQVLRAVTGAQTLDMSVIMAGSLEIAEQPAKRLSQVYVYFAKVNPLTKEDQVDNYRSTVLQQDAQAELEYGTAAIKKIYSRWIPNGGRATAQLIANKHLGRFRDPPRNFKFDLMRYAQTDPLLGSGYFLESWQLQETDGSAASVPIQISSLNPGADHFDVEAEEMLWTPFGGDIDPNNKTVFFDGNENTINLRTRHDQLYPTPQSGQTVTFIVNTGVTIGSTGPSVPAIDVGTWPAGVTLFLINNGRIQGAGGEGGVGGWSIFASFAAGTAGHTGGVALYTRQALNLTNNGEIFGGGGGGGGGGATTDGSSFATGGSGGGGGAGTVGGIGGGGGFGSTTSGQAGLTGTADAGGGPPAVGIPGGTGGGPGLSGTAGTSGNVVGGMAGGSPGAAIDGVSFTPILGGDIRGPTIN